eukprot:c16477_g1_i1 orf=162-572(-)
MTMIRNQETLDCAMSRVATLVFTRRDMYSSPLPPPRLLFSSLNRLPRKAPEFEASVFALSVSRIEIPQNSSSAVFPSPPILTKPQKKIIVLAVPMTNKAAHSSKLSLADGGWRKALQKGGKRQSAFPGNRLLALRV